MSRLQERQNLALSSLHDISDYSSYIDQRISKLNNLYQSLNIPPFRGRHSLRHSPQAQPAQPGQAQRLLRARETFFSKQEEMYRTEYAPLRRDRYRLEESEQLKSITLSHFRNSLDVSRSRGVRNEEKHPVRSKLELYKQVKQDILGTFYVGGQPLGRRQGQEGESRPKRGKLWYGRPPVKIIQRFD